MTCICDGTSLPAVNHPRTLSGPLLISALYVSTPELKQRDSILHSLLLRNCLHRPKPFLTIDDDAASFQAEPEPERSLTPHDCGGALRMLDFLALPSMEHTLLTR